MKIQNTNHLGFMGLLFLLFHCASTLQVSQPVFPYPQDPTEYLEPFHLDAPLISSSYQNQLNTSFNQHYFRPWLMEKLQYSIQQAYWVIPFIRSEQGYGENKLPYPSNWIDEVIQNADSSHYGKSTWNAINTVRSDLRALPTDHPFYLDFNQAGDGFPFDYMQK